MDRFSFLQICTSVYLKEDDRVQRADGLIKEAFSELNKKRKVKIFFNPPVLLRISLVSSAGCSSQK